MIENKAQYRFLRSHRYSVNGREFCYNVAGDIKELPDSRGLKFVAKGICEPVSEIAIEEELQQPENKMLETEKETKKKHGLGALLDRFKK